MLNIFKVKVRSSSLIEVIVALLITSISFTFTFLVIINVNRGSSAFSKSYYDIVGYSYLEDMKANPSNYKDISNIKLPEVNIQTSITDYKGLPTLKLLQVKIYNNQGNEQSSCRTLFNIDEN